MDTETTGLYPWQGSSPFAISVSFGVEGREIYIDRRTEPDSFSSLIEELNEYNGTIFMHNAKFDMAMLEQCFFRPISKDIHCTMALGRVEYFDHLSLSLANLAKKIGFEKSDAVKEYMDKHKLYRWVTRIGKKKREKDYDFAAVPREVMEPYAKKDAHITYQLGLYQISKIKEQKVEHVQDNEKQLTKTFYEMEKVGIKIDKEYAAKGLAYETSNMFKAMEEFKSISGLDFMDSNKVLYEAFIKENSKIMYTEKGNPSFEYDNLKAIGTPLTKTVIAFREAHIRASTYEGILFFSDKENILHANARQAGCATGRVSYSDPPLQCMEKVEKDDPHYNDEFLIRRCFVPREDYFFVMMDFDQFEYRMMMNYAREIGLIAKVKEGLDVHSATAEMMGVPRKTAKTINFMLLYGGGVQKLADALGIELQAAQTLKQKYFDRLPWIKKFINLCHLKIDSDGFITNWFGRKYYLPSELKYKAPNYLIQGGCADWVKVAMNRIQEVLRKHKSRMLLQIHDEILWECHKDEEHLIPVIKNILENVSIQQPHGYLPYTVGVSKSTKSWQDKEELKWIT